MDSNTLFENIHSLHLIDIVVIVVYFLLLIALAVWASRRSKGSVNGYFLAGQNMNFIVVGASLFASNIGSGHFIGLAGSGADSGIAIAGFELNAIYVLLILGWVFLPVYLSSKVYTMPEYIKKRFGGQRIRILLAVFAILLSIFTKISADLYAGAIFIQQSIGCSLYISVGALLFISCLFTVCGGLTAVCWTDFFQTILMIAGAFYLMLKCIIKVGGYEKLFTDFPLAEPINKSFIAFNSANESCSRVTPYYDHLLRPINDPDLPWTGLVIGLTINAVWYWCSDQVIVQRCLSAKNINHAKAGCIFAALLKFLPMYLLVIPGMAARILFPDEVACSNPIECKRICGSERGCTNIAYSIIVLRILPNGATGLMLSVMMAALISSLTSIFNSSATIFVIDIWKRFRKNCSENEQVQMGRLFTVFLMVVSILWIPLIERAQGSQLFHYIQSVTGYLAPPVCAIYVLAIICERINETGAFYGLVIGLLLGCARFAADIIYPANSCNSKFTSRPEIIDKIHYLHFSIILFIFTCLITICISYMTKKVTVSSAYLSKLVKHSINEPTTEINNLGVVNISYTPDELGQNSEIIENESKKESLKINFSEKSKETSSNALNSNYRNYSVICNIFAILLLIIASFFWGYYA